MIVNAVAFSPDGQTVLSGSGDNTLKLWETSSGQLLQTLTGHQDWVTAVAFSPDGETVLSGSGDNTAQTLGDIFWPVAPDLNRTSRLGHCGSLQSRWPNPPQWQFMTTDAQTLGDIFWPVAPDLNRTSRLRSMR